MSEIEQQPVPLQGIGRRAWIMAELHPRAYLWLATLLALLGYACLALFPLLVLAGVAGMYHALTAPTGVAWLQLAAWLPVTGLSGLVSYHLGRYRPALPAGVVLEHSQAPALFELVQDTSKQFAGPGIDRIVITGDYRLDIVATPRSALPLQPLRSLLIGLPLLRILSTPRFQCLLARRLGQFSGHDNLLLNWLYRLRAIWGSYREQPAGTDFWYLPVRGLFALYVPLYNAVSAPVVRLDELQADGCAMELYNDEQVLDAITADAVYRIFLQEKYWPAIRKLGDRVAAAITKAHAGMVAVVHSGLQAENIEHWIARAMDMEQDWDDRWPLLARRVENIGHAQAGMDPYARGATAESYLAVPWRDLEAALEDLPPAEAPPLQPWAAPVADIRQRLQSMLSGLLHKRRLAPHADDQAGELRH